MSQAGARPPRSRRGGGSADLISATRADIEARSRKRRPLVAEVPRLERALAALQEIEGKGPRARGPRPAGHRRPGRARGRRGSGTRADQFLAHVRDNPGVTVAEAAQTLDMGPNCLYRIAATLEREGTVRREGRGFVAPGTEGPAAPEQPGEAGPPPTGVAISLPESGT